MRLPANRARSRLAAVAAAATLALTTLLVSQPAGAARVPDYHPSRLANVGSAQQVLVVTADSWTTTYGTLRAYQRTGKNGWREIVPATPARLGWSGLAPEEDRRQGTGKTPAGTFGLVSAFGRQADPGTDLAYRQVDRDDAWTYNPRVPSTYNVFQTVGRSWDSYGGYVERLWSYGVQYDYVAVMDYNLPTGPIRTGANGVRRATSPADTRKGGGIFLHVTNGKVTAGCIAVPRDTMREILQWLDPDARPIIVVGPESVIDRM